MLTFRYEAMSENGEEVISFHEADSKENAIQEIRGKGLFVYQIHECPELSSQIKQIIADRDRWDQRQREADYRVKAAYRLGMFALANCAFAIYAMYAKNVALSLISIALSILVVTLGARSIKKSIASRNEAIAELAAILPQPPTC